MRIGRSSRRRRQLCDVVRLGLTSVGTGESRRECDEARTLGVLISGRGSNLQALIDAIAEGRLRATIGVVISNRADAAGLDARAGGGHRRPLSSTTAASRPAEAFDQPRSSTSCGRAASRLVCLAGFMRLVGAALLDAFPNAVLNIHPSLLPAFPASTRSVRRSSTASRSAARRCTS